MIKFKLGEYVVHQNIVCEIQSIWPDSKKYSLNRIYPYESLWKDKVDESLIEKWDGTVDKNK